ncbi:Transposon TX1 uncharacterized protein [Glycine max]|nr:Transposon TX1 uncharacterized protein [Glycine max]
MALEEVRSIGRKFTWYRPNGSVMSKLDRFFLSDNWLAQWPDTTQFVMDRNFSDHCPILLRSKIIDRGPKPFKIMNWWMKDKGFQNMWSLSNGVINAKKIQDLKRELNALEAGINDRTLSQAEVEHKKSLQEQLWYAANAYESMLRQKARVKWLKEGDRNSAYFHKMINHRRRHNAIQGLIIDGVWVHDPSSVKNEAFNHFKDRFSEQNLNRPTLDGVQLPSLGQGEKESLVARFIKAEITSGVWDCGGDKSPGPDGLNFNFIKQFWKILKPDFIRNSADFSPWWKDLKSVFQQQHHNSLISNLRWQVGNGAKIKFWKDKWRGDDLNLQDKYPALYQVSHQQDSTISLMDHFDDNRWDWKIHWRRNFFDHEIDMVAAFMDEIDGVQIHLSSMDYLTWRADPSGSYSTKSAYNLLMDDGSSNNEDSASRIMWSLKIPPRASAFSWRLFKNRLPTKANLRRRQVDLPSHRCPLCDVEEESVGHVMFSCTRTRSLCKSYIDRRWEVLWIALSMTIWKHRNSVVFNNQIFNPEKVMDEALFHTWSWLKCMDKDFHIHFNQWSTNLKEELS